MDLESKKKINNKRKEINENDDMNKKEQSNIKMPDVLVRRSNEVFYKCMYVL